VKSFEDAIDKEMREKRALGESKTDKGNDRVWKGGYEARYGERAREMARTEVSKKICDIRELIDHIISESTEAYRGSKRENSFMIYHDALKQFWEKGAREYIASKNFENRVLRIQEPFFKDVVKRYQDGVVGDSPEMARGLDSYGFQDLELSIQFHVALTSGYADNDPRKFKLGTPNEVWNTMVRCWQIDPSPDRVIADIEDWPRVLQVIVDAKGCVVHGEAVRSGHRYQRKDGAGLMKSKLKSHGRVATFHGRPVHPDALEAFRSLTDSKKEAVEAVVQVASTLEDYLTIQRDNSEIYEEGDIDENNF